VGEADLFADPQATATFFRSGSFIYYGPLIGSMAGLDGQIQYSRSGWFNGSARSSGERWGQLERDAL